MEQKKRMLSQDIAKAICILSVVVTHTLGIKGNHPLTWYNYLIMCPMGFFFLISGYNYRPGKRTIAQNISIRAKQLILPLFTYTIFFSFVALILNLTAGYASMFTIGKAVYTSLTGSGLEKTILYSYILTEDIVGAELFAAWPAFVIPSWFLVYMFVGYIVFYLLVDFAMANKKRFVSINIGLVALSMIFFVLLSDVLNPFGLIDAPFIASLLLIGCYLGNNKFLDTETHGKKWTIINSIVAGILCFLLALYKKGACLIPAGRLGSAFGVAEIPLTAIVSILYTYALINFCKLLEKIPVFTPCCLWFGRNSLRVFLIHMPVSSFIGFFTGFSLNHADGTSQTVGEFFALFGLTFAITIAICLVIDVTMNFFHKKQALKKNKQESEKVEAK